LDPLAFNSWWDFTHKHCGYKKTKWGVDVSGATNLPELQEKLRATVMVRRMKADVLNELPPKIRQIITLNGGGAAVVRFNEAYAKAKAEKYVDAVNEMEFISGVPIGEMAIARHEIAMEKVPQVIDYINEFDHPVVIFAHHKDVIQALQEGITRECVTVVGGQPMEERQKAVDRFQSGEVDVFIGNIKAAGVGLTLTRASHVCMVELDWTPANVLQAEDRCHRMGQTDTVFVQHFTFQNSIEEHICKLIMEKQKIIEQAIDVQNH
jgi:SWI/SNF-related matrix-associated actin-dependent regulator 1 of chromatin subfamily A